MRKFVIIFAAGFTLLVGLWGYCLFAAPPPVSDFARGATRGVASVVGLKVFEESADKTAAGALKETVANLPDGYYLFLGQKPAQASPKWVVVNPGGGIAWLNVGAPAPNAVLAQNVALASNSGNNAAPKVVVDSNSAFEKYEYPLIKWKAKPLGDSAEAVAQLQTTFEPAGADSQKGEVKYRLTLFKTANHGARAVQLLDANGFKLLQFNASDFHAVPNSELMEARDSFDCEQAQYLQARDYTVD
jgi:hypothetical protein